MDQQRIYTILNDKNFKQEVLENPEPVLVEVGADWCGACHIIAPILEKLALIYEGQIRFEKINIDVNEWITKEYNIIDLPIVLFFKNGNIVDHIIGIFSRNELEARIRNLLQY